MVVRLSVALYAQEDALYSFLLEAESTSGPYVLWLEGFGQLKNPMASVINQLNYYVT
jgi:hypothetical protein